MTHLRSLTVTTIAAVVLIAMPAGASGTSDTKGCDKFLKAGSTSWDSRGGGTWLRVIATRNIRCSDAVHAALSSSDRCFAATEASGNIARSRCTYRDYRCRTSYKWTIGNGWVRESLHCMKGKLNRFGYTKLWQVVGVA